LVEPDGEPFNPTAYLTMIPNYDVGDTFVLAFGEEVRAS
jgi:hypothetical protein